MSRRPWDTSRDVYRIALVGMYPPPIGGVSVHVKRLKKEVDDVLGSCIVHDLGGDQKAAEGVVPFANSWSWFWSFLIGRFSASVVHYHGSSWRFRAFAAFLLKLRSVKSVFTIHSLREELEEVSLITKACIMFALRFGDFFIVVAPHIQQKLLGWGARPQNIAIIPGFIPPRIEQEDFSGIPDYIWTFIDQHTPVVTANAYRISFFRGEDLYGIDLCVQLCVKLRATFPNIGFVFCLPDIGDQIYFEKLQHQLVENRLNSNFLFVHEQIEYYPILAKADLFVRPTNTDGDAISVREALSLKTSVVCSDVVSRPDGVVLFKNRDLPDLVEKSRQSLELIFSIGHSEKAQNSNAVSDFSSTDAILRIYNRLLESDSEIDY